ncbi:hypothetical protein BKI52_19320 [marine bacterium AO1-C]|nr:hypothetical protein BKI52_19320 [marine bacterium AO1-C]
MQLTAGNGLGITIDGTGRWGVDDGSTGQLGFTFNGKDLLKNATTGRNEAGLMLGLSATRVSDVVKISNTTRSTDWVLQGSIGTGNTSGDLKELVAVYKEAGTVTSPLGLEITQRVYGWNTTSDVGYVILEYRLKNTSSDTLKQLSLGVFADWNLGTASENRADWDANNNLGYIYESGGTGTHAGIALLTAQTSQYYAFDQDGTAGSINITDGFSKAEKYESMSSGNLARSKAGETGNGNDVAHTVGASIITIAPGETTMVAFVLVAGTSLTELQSRVTQAKSRFQTRYTSPTPTLPSDLKTCGPTGEVTVTPTGGTNFRFYDQVPTLGVTTPIGEGASLRVANITANRTIYVTSTDSLFEGSHTSVTVRYLYPSVSIADGLRELCVDGNLTLTASALGAGSTPLSYQWQRNGQNIGSDSVAVLINEPGTYKVTVSEEGCTRTSSEVTITQIQKPVIAQNGTDLAVTATADALTYQWFYNNLPLTGANASSYTPRATGAYTVRVSFGNGCEVLSDAFQVEVTSLSQAPAPLQGVKVYPIPVPNQGEFTLELPQNTSSSKGYEVTLIDFAGRVLLKTGFAQGGKYLVNLPGHWPQGIYFLKVSSKGTSTKQAIIKLAIQK